MKKSLIFDLDGTLVDTVQDISVSMNTVLANKKLPALPINLYRSFIGKGTESMVYNVSSLVGYVNPEELHEQYISFYENNLTRHSLVYDGLNDLIERCNSFKIPVSVVTNKHHHMANEILNTLLPNIKFEYIRGYKKDGVRKPSPEMSIEISNALGIDPQQTLFIGDTVIDIKTARNAGMNSAAVLWGYSDQKDFENNLPDFFFNSVSQLSDFVFHG